MMLPTNVRRKVSREELKTLLESRSKPFELLKISDIVYSERSCSVLIGVKLEHIVFENCYFENVSFTNSTFTRSSFIDCEMIEPDFRFVQFQGLTFDHCGIKCSNFAESNWTTVDVKYTDMSLTNFKKSKFHFVNFNNCDLEDSKFDSVEMTEVEFKISNLNRASFQNVKFNDDSIQIIQCNLYETNFSQSKGLLNPIDYLSENFEWNNDGMIVYKIFDHFMPTVWPDFKRSGDILTEEPNYDRTSNFSCGINAANQEWFQNINQSGTFERVPKFSQDVWKCLIKFQWLPGVVVPYNPEGQIRCCRLQLIKKFTEMEIYNFYKGE